MLWTVTEHLEMLREFRLSADLGGYASLRSDVVLKKDKEIIVIELTVFYEANTQKVNDYERKEYSDSRDYIILECEIYG